MLIFVPTHQASKRWVEPMLVCNKSEYVGACIVGTLKETAIIVSVSKLIIKFVWN